MDVTKGGQQTNAGKSNSAAGLPAGWVVRTKPRFLMASDKHPNNKLSKYWYSPLLNLKFRSREYTLGLFSSEWLYLCQYQTSVNLTILKYYGRFRQIEVQSVRRFLGYLEKANGDEGIAIDSFRKNSTNDVDRRAGPYQARSTVDTTKSSEATRRAAPRGGGQKSSPVVNVGDVGYKFRKEFDSGWFSGTVVEIRPLAGK